MRYRLLLLPFSFLYSVIARLRNLFFDTGIFKQHKFTLPVILVGNLSVGGTGKTPHVEYLLTLLRKEFRLATLSRGYGRKSKGFVMAGNNVTAAAIGDEPMQYFSKFDDVTVAVCENRVEGIEKLISSDNKPQVIIMDDGFQHRHVNPGFKILLTAADKLFTNDYILPAGDLREPRSAYRRADCIIITRCEEGITELKKQELAKEINVLPHQQLFFSSLMYDNPIHFFSQDIIALSELPSRNILLFTGIANSSHLQSFLEKNSASIQVLHFPDHHTYTKKDIDELKQKFDKFAGTSPIILTTEKDYHRLRSSEYMKELSSLPCYYIPIRVKIDKEEIINNLIRKYVEENKGNS